jgi:thioredoxin-like negative regulator of GroEL
MQRRVFASVAARRSCKSVATAITPLMAAPPLAQVTPSLVAPLQAASAVRWSSSGGDERGAAATAPGKGQDPKKVMAEARKLMKNLPPGVVRVTDLNFDVEFGMNQGTPVILYFHSSSNAEVLEYTKCVIRGVDAINREAQMMAVDPETGVATGGSSAPLRVKCGMIDVEREYELAQQFRIARDMFPLVYFVAHGRVVDKMFGVVPESQVTQALGAFLRWSDENKNTPAPGSPEAMRLQQGKKPLKPTSPATEGTGGPGATMPKDEAAKEGGDATSGPAGSAGEMGRMDEWDENPMTLQQTAIRKTQNKDYPKAFELFTKSRTQAELAVAALKKELGYDRKKMTSEMVERMRQDPNFMALPQAICGQAMVKLAQKHYDEAYAFATEVRKDFAWAVKLNLQIADTMARVELIKIAGYDPDQDNYVTLCRKDELVDNTVDFYQNQIRLAVAHYFERHPEMAVDELLRLIRAEPKMMPSLLKAGAITPPEDGSPITASNKTPARRLIFVLFEAMGNQHDAVMKARKKLQSFL